jgi:hypothetical protein
LPTARDTLLAVPERLFVSQDRIPALMLSITTLNAITELRSEMLYIPAVIMNFL